MHKFSDKTRSVAIKVLLHGNLIAVLKHFGGNSEAIVFGMPSVNRPNMIIGLGRIPQCASPLSSFQ